MKRIFNRNAIFQIILALLIFQEGSSQGNYKPGYIIQMNGDTIKGFIKHRNWSTTPNKITFGTNLTDRKEYGVLDILGFGVGDEYFESATINLEVGESAQLIFQSTIVFLQALVRGEKSLYSYNAKEGVRFYIKIDPIKKETTTISNSTRNSTTTVSTISVLSHELLLYKTYSTVINGIQRKVENKRYIGQLITYLADCPNLKQKAESTEYTRNSIEDLFRFYSGCTNKRVQIREKQKSSIQLGLVGGLVVTTMTITNAAGYMQNHNFINGVNYETSTNFTGGFYLNIPLQKKNLFSVYNEILFTTFLSTGKSGKVDVSVGYSTLKMNNMLQANIPIHTIHLTLSAGPSIGYAFNRANSIEGYVNSAPVNGIAINQVRSVEVGLNLVVGVKVKKFSISARLEQSNGIAIDANQKIKRDYFLLSYQF